MSRKLVSPAKLYWVTGLAGSGKSTLGQKLAEELHKRNIPLLFLDGDDIRSTFGNDLGYSIEDRLKGSWRNARLCKLLTDQGITVICATISLFNGVQQWNRDNIPGYIEIFMDTSMEILIKRDQKNLYSEALEHKIDNVVGFDIQPEFPKCPHFKVGPFDNITQTTMQILRRFDV